MTTKKQSRVSTEPDPKTLISAASQLAVGTVAAAAANATTTLASAAQTAADLVSTTAKTAAASLLLTGTELKGQITNLDTKISDVFSDTQEIKDHLKTLNGRVGKSEVAIGRLQLAVFSIFGSGIIIILTVILTHVFK